ncbi:MAG: ABC transporter ATP-binding protein, partial [Acidimicrobiales bacterium]
MRGMGMGMGPRSTASALIHSLRLDESVLEQKLPPGILKRIGKFAAPYRFALAGFLALIVVDALIGAANPLLLREVIDKGILKKDVHLIVAVALVLVGLALIDAAETIGQRFLSARIGEGLIYDMRTRVFDHVGRMPLAFFTRTQTGALISRLNNDVLGAQQAFTNTFQSVIGNLITIGVTLVAMFVLSWQITLMGLVILPVFLFPARWVGKRLARITRNSYGLAAKMNQTLAERFNVSGALLVKLYGRVGSEENSFAERAAEVRDIGITSSMYSGVFLVALILTASLSTAVVYGVGGVFAAHGELQVGTLVALTAYLNRLYGPLTQISNVQIDVMTALVSFDRVFEVLDLAPLIGEKPDAVELPRGGATVEFDDVYFSYPTAEEVSLASLESVAVLESAPRAEVLHGISFRADPGELVALVGPSGAGKTTISQLVPRIYDVRSGAVRVDGVDVRDATLASLQAVVGVVTQDAHLFHETIRSNLLYANPEASEEDLFEVLEAAQILPLVQSLPEGLDTLVGDRGYRLSGGEKQRIAIARLLLKAPDVVV